ncbi:MAG: hypothetical protein P8H56_09850 [Crocinitomicaceae bacterium]|nr:hypothetical protein [Crocinitomicaceae bacterium]
MDRKKKSYIEAQQYEDNYSESDLEAKRVRIDETNFTELFELYVNDNEVIADLMVREEGTLSTYEVDLFEELSIEMAEKIFDTEKIRLNSTNELFSGIMYFAENGQVLKEFSLKNGKLNGRVKSYYDSGEISSNSLWENGKRISLKCWDLKGNLKDC